VSADYVHEMALGTTWCQRVLGKKYWWYIANKIQPGSKNHVDSKSAVKTVHTTLIRYWNSKNHEMVLGTPQCQPILRKNYWW